MRTARVDQGLPAVVLDLGNDAYVVLRVMDHDAAYRVAERLRVDVSTFDGLPRLIDMSAVA